MKIKNSLVFALCFMMIPLLNQAQAGVGYKVGDTAPGFKLKSLNGKSYSLADLTRKGHVLLVFWAVECVYCYAHIKEYKRIHRQYKNKLTLAAINIGGEYPVEVSEYVKDNQLEYLILSDRLNNLDVGESYHAVVTPTMVLISPGRKILYNGHKLPDLSNWLK